MRQVVALHINSERPAELGAFYQALLGQAPAWAGEGMTGFMLGDFRLEIAQHDAVRGPNAQPARIFFDLIVADVRAEFARAVALGATVVQAPYDFADEELRLVIATLADPDGNYFQLVSME
jgi:predicted enzyme related to lactoylglutathione lyase